MVVDHVERLSGSGCVVDLGEDARNVVGFGEGLAHGLGNGRASTSWTSAGERVPGGANRAT